VLQFLAKPPFSELRITFAAHGGISAGNKALGDASSATMNSMGSVLLANVCKLVKQVNTSLTLLNAGITQESLNVIAIALPIPT
jgi:hypothetical protein